MPTITLEKTNNGKVLYNEDGEVKYAFDPSLNVLPYPRFQNTIIITAQPAQGVYDSDIGLSENFFLIEVTNIDKANCSPAISASVDTLPEWIEELATNFFFRVASSPGGGGSWGSITGTLSSQTDLQNALNAKKDLSPDPLPTLADWGGLFDMDYVIGTEASPVSGNILYDFTGANLGAKAVIFHSSATAPTFPAETKYLAGVYVRNVVNRILLEYDVASAVVSVTISQPATSQIPDIKAGFSLQLSTNPVGGTAITGGTTAVGTDNILGAFETIGVTSANARGRTPLSANFFKASGADWVLDFKTRLTNAPTTAENFALFLGFAGTTTNPHSASSRTAIILQDGLNSGKFALQLGASDSFDLGITGVAGTVYDFVMERIAGVGIKVWINGVLRGTFSDANIPTSDARPMYVITKTNGTGAVSVDVGSMTFGIYDI